MKRDMSFNYYLGFEDMNNGTLESFEDGRGICNKEKLVSDTRRTEYGAVRPYSD